MDCRSRIANATFPSISTFARLLCALPALESLHLCRSCAFVKHGFDLRSVPVPPGIPLQLAVVQLTDGFCIDSEPCSVTDLVDFFVATGLGKSLRRIKACLSPILRVANEVDVTLNRLVKHSAQSLRHLSLDSTLSYWISNDTYEWVHSDHSAAPYFDVSENTCLERLDLTVQVTHQEMTHSCVPMVEILSQVTSTHISIIQVHFTSYCQPGELGVELDVDLEKLMEGFPQLDAVLSAPIFDGLTHVVVDVTTLDSSDVRDRDSAHELRLCLPVLDARGILGINVNNIMIGLYLDEEIGEWKRLGIE